MRLLIVGSALPGLTYSPPNSGGSIYNNVHVGLQRRAEVEQLISGDASQAVWEVDIDVIGHGDEIDFRGPFVQGRKGDRFLYLSWGTVDKGDRFQMFRRAKLMLEPVDRDIVRRADRPAARLVGRLNLTGGDGGPLCAAVRPPVIEWTADTA